MAKNRSRRLRKKMHIDEFQELGFSVAWRFPEGTSEEQSIRLSMTLLMTLLSLINWRLTAAATWPGKG